MQNRDYNENKRKVTAVLAQVAEMERKYWETLANNEVKTHGPPEKPQLPHKVDVSFITAVNTIATVTLIPYTLESQNTIQGWDDHRRHMWAFDYSVVVDAQLNSNSYVPFGKEEWKRCVQESELKTNDEMVIKQKRGQYISYRAVKSS